MICIYLPRYHGTEAAPDIAIVLQNSAPATPGKTVLLVDDVSTIRMPIREVLADLGYAALQSRDGVAALKVLKSKQRSDRLVTDVGLSNGSNGRQLTDAARVMWPGLPVIFIRECAENAVFSHGHHESGYEVPSKPFAMGVGSRRISTLMNRS